MPTSRSSPRLILLCHPLPVCHGRDCLLPLRHESLRINREKYRSGRHGDSCWECSCCDRFDPLSLSLSSVLREDLRDGRVRRVGVSLHVQLHAGLFHSDDSPPHSYQDQLTGYVLPTLFVAFIAWLTGLHLSTCLLIVVSLATMFLEILTVTSDTLLQVIPSFPLLCSSIDRLITQGYLIEEEFERNASKGRGVTKNKSHAQKSLKSVLEKQESMRPEVVRQHSQL
jgi:hypothetical protein